MEEAGLRPAETTQEIRDCRKEGANISFVRRIKHGAMMTPGTSIIFSADGLAELPKVLAGGK